jgi:hypothetical protein
VLGLAALLYWSGPTVETRDSPSRVWRRAACFTGGVLAPLAVALTVFAWHGMLGVYWFANVRFNLAYTEIAASRLELLLAILQRRPVPGVVALVASAIAAAIWLLASSRRNGRQLRGPVVIVTAWLVSAVAAVFVAAKFYGHHFLQALPAAVVLIAVAVTEASRSRRTMIRYGVPALLMAVMFALALDATRDVGRVAEHRDVPRAVAAFLRAHDAEGSVVFVANSQPIIYLLAGVRAPTRYVLPVWYVRPEFRRRLGIDLEGFLDQVFDQRPTFVVLEWDHPWLSDRPMVKLLTQKYLPGRYREVARIGPAIVFSRLENDP